MEALIGQAAFGRRLVGYVEDSADERLAVAGESGVTWVASARWHRTRSASWRAASGSTR